MARSPTPDGSTPTSAPRLIKFEGSTQMHVWMFDSEDALKAERRRVHNKAIDDVKQKLQAAGQTARQSARICAKLPTAEDEEILKQYILQAAYKFMRDYRAYRTGVPFPPRTCYIALELFRRFYTRRSILMCPPKRLVKTAMWAATKLTDFYLPIRYFVRSFTTDTPEQNERTIRRLEAVLYPTLDNCLLIFTPLEPLYGFMLQIRAHNKAQETPYSVELLDKLEHDAREFILDSSMSDALMLFTPITIALTALVHAEQGVEWPNATGPAAVTRWLPEWLREHHEPDSKLFTDSLRRLFDECARVVTLVEAAKVPLSEKDHAEASQRWNYWCSLGSREDTGEESTYFDSEEEWVAASAADE